jgi:hypothetical protein
LVVGLGFVLFIKQILRVLGGIWSFMRLAIGIASERHKKGLTAIDADFLGCFGAALNRNFGCYGGFGRS